MSCALHHVMAKWPSRKAVPIATVMSTQGYGATFFTAALSRYIIELKNPGLTRNEVEARALQVQLPFSTVPVFHKIKFRNVEHHGKETLDSIHARPQEAGQSGDILIPACFDTVLVQVRLGPNEGLAAEPRNGLSGRPLIVVTFDIQLIAGRAGMRVGRVHVIFSIPGKALLLLFPGAPVTRPTVPRHLVYIEWLSKFTNAPDPLCQMYKIKMLQ